MTLDITPMVWDKHIIGEPHAPHFAKLHRQE